MQEFPTGGSSRLDDYANKLTSDFINHNMITFEYSEENKDIYISRDVR